MSDDKSKFEIVFEGRGVASGKMRNDINVRWPGQGEEFQLATDEGPFHGGDGTAPPPLALFTAGFIGCIMTQIRAFGKRLNIPVEDLAVSARMHWKAEQVGRDPYESAPVGFGFDIEFESSASEADKIRLVEAAKKGCFIDQTLAVSNKVAHRLKTADGWVDV